MRLMSVTLTEAQVRAQTKTVTRRLGWQPGKMVRPGQRLQLCRKVMGRRRADGTVEPLERIAVVEVVSARREPLFCIMAADVAAEGFPGMSPVEFVEFFCRSMRCTPQTYVTRIEWFYVATDDGTPPAAVTACRMAVSR